MHNNLENKFEWYRKWHEHAGSNTLHWFALIAFVALVFNFTTSSVSNSTYIAEQSAYVNSALPENASDTAREVLSRANNSDLVVSGIVEEASSRLETNAFGDKIIMTKVKTSVSEWFKGSSNKNIEVEMMGGTVDGITMSVSEHPTPLKKGEYAILYLSKKGDGYTLSSQVETDHGEEDSVIKLKRDGRSDDDQFTIDQIRSVFENSK